MNKILIFIFIIILSTNVNAFDFNNVFKDFTKLITGFAIKPLSLEGERQFIACYSNSDCDDNNLCTQDTCNNAETVNSYCSHLNLTLCSKCEDKTTINECSVAAPLYCDSNLNLVNDCSLCGCPNGFNCQSDGSCKQMINDCEFDNGNCLTSCSLDEYEDSYLSTTCNENQNTNLVCCKEKTIQDGTCFDNIKNQDEIGIDCGGICEKRCELTKLDFTVPKLSGTSTDQRSSLVIRSLRKQNIVLENEVVGKKDLIIKPISMKFAALSKQEVTIKAVRVENKLNVDVSDVKMELSVVDNKPKLSIDFKII